jgi:hypothetical protein
VPTFESDVDILIVLDDVSNYAREIEKTGYLISALSLEFEVSISRFFVSSEAWQHGDSPFLANVREYASAA